MALSFRNESFARLTHRGCALVRVFIGAGAGILLALTLLGWGLVAALPGCHLSEDGGFGCALFGVDMNMFLFLLCIGGAVTFIAWCAYFIVPFLISVWLQERVESAIPSLRRTCAKNQVGR